MASLKNQLKGVRKFLSREVNLPIKSSDGRVGQALTKKRKVFFADYVGQSYTEMRKVVWPTRSETARLTLAVVIFTGLFTLFMVAADQGISSVVERVLL